MAFLPPHPPTRAVGMALTILLSFVACAFFVASSLFSVDGQQQQQTPLLLKDGTLDLIYELKKAEIIPTVLDEFHPLLTISVTWKNATADYGNTVNPSKTKHQPDIEFIDTTPSSWNDKDTPQLTIAMTDPDAPSRDNPEWSEICHWIATDIDLTPPDDNKNDHEDQDSHAPGLRKRMMDVMPFKPPGPPPKTGKHRYVFVALAPKNGTSDALHLKKPNDRQHWGFKHERNGLRMWAEEMGLDVVGANFIYAQNDDQ